MTYPDLDLITIDRDWFAQRRGFITGASGWFGSWICQALDNIGASYLTLKRPDDNIDNFRFPEQHINYIIHLAPGSVHRVCMLAKRHQVDAVLFTSSGAVYADELDDYGAMKLNNERAFMVCETPVKVARCFTFAGPGIPLNQGYAFGNFISAGFNKEPIKVWGDGNTIRTYMYMTDLVTWLFRILVHGRYGAKYDVGSECEVSIIELAHKISKRFKPRPDVLIMNKHTDRRPYYVPDTYEAGQLGCKQTISLDEAIDKTIDYYRRQYD